MHTPPEKNIWFPAKRYGWGWGPPCAWQGWVVLAVWFVLLLTSALVLVERSPLTFFILALVLNAALIYLCWRKGEKPRWRWGKK